MPEEHACPVTRLERAVIDGVAELTEGLAQKGWESDKATKYIAGRIGRAARQGLAIGNAGIAASGAIQEATDDEK
jgi:hypothetical protein